MRCRCPRDLLLRLLSRITPQFSGGALTHVPWHFIPNRPLQLLVSSHLRERQYPGRLRLCATATT